MSVNQLQMEINQLIQKAELKAKKIRKRMLERDRDYRTQIKGLEEQIEETLTENATLVKKWDRLKGLMKEITQTPQTAAMLELMKTVEAENK